MGPDDTDVSVIVRGVPVLIRSPTSVPSHRPVNDKGEPLKHILILRLNKEEFEAQDTMWLRHFLGWSFGSSSNFCSRLWFVIT